MRIAFAVLLFVHGLIHLLGFAKGFGFSEVAALKLPIGRVAGSFWLLAAVGFVAAAALLLVTPGRWWIAAAPALLVSQVLVFGAWSDAKFGSLPNLIALLPVIVSIAAASPNGFRSVYERESVRRLEGLPPSAPIVTEADLAPLPAPLQTFLRKVGVVGRPRVLGFRARFHGRLRNGLDAPWMSFTSEQHNFVDAKEPAARLFFIDASMKGVPFDGLHAFMGGEARMQIRVGSLVDVVDGRGPEMNQGETVTIFNDLCVMAPGALLAAPIRWTELDARHVRGEYTRQGITVSAVLSFDDQGDLVDFVSEDRFLSSDGKTFQKLPWSTPMRGRREFGGVRLPARGDATWKTAQGDFVYGEFNLEEIEYFPAARSG